MVVFIVAVLATLATARGTRLITADVIFQPIRTWVVRGFGEESKAAYLVHCEACVSIWVGAIAATWASLFTLPWWTWPLQAAAYSELTILTRRQWGD